MLETLHYTIRIGSTPTMLYFDLLLTSCFENQYEAIPTQLYNPVRPGFSGERQRANHIHRPFLKHEQQCFIVFKTRGDSWVFQTRKTRAASVLDSFKKNHFISLLAK